MLFPAEQVRLELASVHSLDLLLYLGLDAAAPMAIRIGGAEARYEALGLDNSGQVARHGRARHGGDREVEQPRVGECLRERPLHRLSLIHI